MTQYGMMNIILKRSQALIPTFVASDAEVLTPGQVILIFLLMACGVGLTMAVFLIELAWKKPTKLKSSLYSKSKWGHSSAVEHQSN